MDYRLKKQVVAIAVLMVLAIVTIVLLVNGILLGGSSKKKSSAATETEESSDDTVVLSAYAALAAAYDLDTSVNPYAFLSMEGFFDADVEEAVDPATVLQMIITSVEKDLRVTVLDGNGEVVKGYTFVVQVESSSGTVRRYKDADQDGSIYIAPVATGQYQISLEEVEGYTTNEDFVVASVKENIEYTLLSDVSYLIKSADEIDESAEDTEINEAELDADGTETTKALTDEDALFGIDVSKWNKDIDWEAVAAAGVDFAIIRVGYRGSSTGSLVEDSYFEKNIKEATEAGIKVGIYFFTQATTEVEAVEEASMAIMLARDYKLTLPIFIDTEGAGGSGRADSLDVEGRTAVCKAFCETIENAGYTAGIYASKNWYNNNLDMTELDGYTIWVAQYSHTLTYEGTYSLWQYTSAGTIDGISTRVDLDLCYIDY